MILIFYLMLNLIGFIFFILEKKKLHILEIMVYWMVGSYLFQNFSALCYMNFKTIIIPEKLSLELTHFLNRMALFPLLMVAFLDYFHKLNANIKKIALLISFIFLFVGLEWLADLLGVIHHVHWQIWWSYSFWLAALLTLLGFMKIFRKFLYRGGLDS